MGVRLILIDGALSQDINPIITSFLLFVICPQALQIIHIKPIRRNTNESTLAIGILENRLGYLGVGVKHVNLEKKPIIWYTRRCN